jgi:hypothetical protein
MLALRRSTGKAGAKLGRTVDNLVLWWAKAVRGDAAARDGVVGGV